MLDPLVLAMFKGAEAAGLPVTFHLSPFIGYSYGLVVSAGLPELEMVLQQFPKLKIFAHSQTFWAEMGANPTVEERMGYPTGKIQEEGRIPQLMRKYENLYGDLSAGSGCNALSRDPEYAAKFLTEFQDRLLFGTDNCQPKGHMIVMDILAKFLLDLRQKGKISETVFQKVARENAIRLLGL
jgi:predicted TIM-barrel fold metal-dependent hydrolase